jgi:hypothetical protein
VILEPHLDDLDPNDQINDDGSLKGSDQPLDALGKQIDQSGRVYVWQQSGSTRLIAADLVSVTSPVALEPLRRGSREAALLSVEKHGRGFGAIFKEGQRYLLSLYSPKGALRRTQPLKSPTLAALELKYQDDLDGNGSLGPRQSRRAADPARGALLGEPIQPFEGFMVGSGLDPLASMDPLTPMVIPSVVCDLLPPLF